MGSAGSGTPAGGTANGGKGGESGSDGGEAGMPDGSGGKGGSGGGGMAGRGGTSVGGAAGEGGGTGDPCEGAPCSVDCPCDAGGGPCATDDECAGALVCGIGDGPKLGRTGNVCIAAHCTNDETDAGETTQDCGGDCGCPVLEELATIESCAAAVSTDGRVVVGHVTDGEGPHPRRWIDAEDWTELSGGFPVLTAVSSDGDVVVGRAGSPITPARWDAPDFSLTDLGPPTALYPIGGALGVSGDGRVVVGNAIRDGAPEQQAFRWRQGLGFELLGFVDGGSGSMDQSVAWGISADGEVIVGSASTSGGLTVPFRWTEAGGMEDLGGIPGGLGEGEATATTPDGSIVVGSSLGASQREAFIWESGSGGITTLGNLPVSHGGMWARDVSDDGERVVGTYSDTMGRAQGFLWDRATGLTTLRAALQARGFEDPLTSRPSSDVTALSADGRFAIGCTRDSDQTLYAFRLKIER